MFTIKATNYRGLPNIHWEIPRGLSVLTGPNGAGKSTLLGLFQFLALALGDLEGDETDVALYLSGGAASFLHRSSPENAVTFELELGEIAWKLRVAVVGKGVAPYPYERIQYNQNTLFERIAGSQDATWRGQDVSIKNFSALKTLQHNAQFSKQPFVVEPLLQVLEHSTIFYDYDLSGVKSGCPDGNSQAMGPNGSIVFTVLRNWGDTLEGQEKRGFVVETLRDIFPFFRSLGFERGGETIEGFFYHTKYPQDKFSMRAAPNGFLTALLHLSAVAGANPGNIVCIDDFETCLHPEAITKLLTAIEERATKKNLSVVIATQSPQVVNFFNDKPEKVYIVDDRLPSAPTPLLALRNRDWLSYFKLGDKFMEGDFAGFSLESDAGDQ